MRVLIALVCVVGFATGAHADRLAAGGLFGGPSQTKAVCYFFNTHPTQAIRLNNPRIMGVNGNSLPLTVDECRNVVFLNLPAQKICGIAADVAGNNIHSCEVGVASKIELRGVFQLRDAAQNVLISIPLQ